MKILIIMGCGVIAAACATGKRTDRPVDYPQTEASTTVATTPERSVAPDHHDSSATSDPEGSAQSRRAERTPAGRGDARSASSQLSTVGEGPAASPPQAAPPAPAPVAAPAPQQVDADNTRKNERDRGGDTLTPMDQGSSDVDIKLTQQVRKAVVGDSTLSFSAKNVKIISRDGKVTLRGAVKSERERKAIGDMASKVAGPANVDNQLEVAN